MSNAIAKLQIKRGEKHIITFGSLHWVPERHWACIKLKAVWLGYFSTWLRSDLVSLGDEWRWPFIKGAVMCYHGKGLPTQVGFLWTDTTATGRPCYNGELFMIPVGKVIEDEEGCHITCPIFLEDQG